MSYNLERFPVFALGPSWGNLRWTRKVPAEVKNWHRAFWGFAPLK